MELTLYTRPDCPRCEQARRAVHAARARAHFTLVEIDATRDPLLMDRCGKDLPVLLIDGRPAFERDVSEQALFERIAPAAPAAAQRATAAARKPRSSRRSKVTVLIGLFVVVALGAIKIREILHSGTSLLDIGVEALHGAAPSFEFKDHDGKTVTLADFRGKTVFLNYWATWCEPCRMEMPSMADLARRMKGDDFVMVAASVDDDWTAIDAFLASQYRGATPPFVVLHDPGSRWSRTYGTEKFPETYVIGPDGNLQARFIGPRQWQRPEYAAYLELVMGRGRAQQPQTAR